MENDKVKHPQHYTAYGMETIDLIRNSMSANEFQGYCKGNVIKYVSRYRFKNGSEDLQKAMTYLDWLDESYRKGPKNNGNIIQQIISWFKTVISH